jgi:hypothetical protein
MFHHRPDTIQAESAAISRGREDFCPGPGGAVAFFGLVWGLPEAFMADGEAAGEPFAWHRSKNESARIHRGSKVAL